jgi:hypothetical protein
MNDKYPFIFLYLGMALAILGSPCCILHQLPCFNDMSDRCKSFTLGIGSVLVVGGLVLIGISILLQVVPN